MMEKCFNKQCSSQKLVSKDEAKQILAAHLIPMEHPYVIALFDDGKYKETLLLDYDALVDIYRDIKDNVNDKTLAERLETFKQYDHNENGFIERKELEKYLEEDQHYNSSEFETVIDLVMYFGDTNGDGKLNYIEFLNMLE